MITPGQTLRERQRQVREDAILDAAHDLMMEQGFAAVSMDDVANRVGVSKATLYQHFPSKEELAINVIVRSMRRGEEQIKAMDTGVPAILRLARVIKNAIENRAAINTARMLLPPALVQHHPLYQAQKARMMAAIGSLIEHAKAEGAVVAHIPTPIIIRMVMTTVRAASEGELLEASEADQGELSDLLVTLLFDGIRAKPPIEAGGQTQDGQ